MFGLFGKTKAYEEINGAEFKKKMKEPGAVVLDVRTRGEFSDGHIPRAVNIDLMSPSFTGAIDKLDRNKTYLVYCRSGNRSGEACSIMTSRGFKAFNLAGGIGAVRELV
jgi:rhodanese-related sulfurtransferase